jgi:hypothetical protein
MTSATASTSTGKLAAPVTRDGGLEAARPVPREWLNFVSDQRRELTPAITWSTPTADLRLLLWAAHHLKRRERPRGCRGDTPELLRHG